MSIRLSISIFLSKIAIKACRLVKRGGTTLPGKIALKIYPDFLKTVTGKLKIIMVTGTNGKTTTTKIISHIFDKNGIKYITNKSGANLVSGVVTTFISHMDLFGRFSVSTALIEIDEAAFKSVSSYISPDVLVVTNFFRDQLDRYGELYLTLDSVRAGIKKCSKTHLILNADDSMCASLGRNISNKVTYFGFDENSYEGVAESTNSDAMFCIYCKSKYDYSLHTYGHLGSFKCSSCGYEKPSTSIACSSLIELANTYSLINLRVNDHIYEAKINLPGLYNVYNALAAAACSVVMGLDCSSTIEALGTFECVFGRMETIETCGKFIKVILVKNPTGFNQVLNYLATVEKKMQIAFIINDKLADGTDISWLWDVDFEKLISFQDRIITAYASGLRAEDMAVRLKYAGIEVSKIKVCNNSSKLIKISLEQLPEGHSLYILPTYTAMLEIRKVLKNMFNLKNFWE